MKKLSILSDDHFFMSGLNAILSNNYCIDSSLVSRGFLWGEWLQEKLLTASPTDLIIIAIENIDLLSHSVFTINRRFINILIISGNIMREVGLFKCNGYFYTGKTLTPNGLRSKLNSIFLGLETTSVKITEKQMVIIKYLMQGQRVTNIAKKLHLSCKTVSAHKMLFLSQFDTKGTWQVLRVMELLFSLEARC